MSQGRWIPVVVDGARARSEGEGVAESAAHAIVELRARMSTAFSARGLPGFVGSGLEHRRVLSTGDARLDAALPGGGFPRGALSLLVGPEGVGRVSIAAQAVAEETAAGRAAAWVDVGGRLYPPALVERGVRLERLLLVRTPDPIKAARALEQVAASGLFRVVAATGIEAALTAVRAKKLEAAARGAGVAVLCMVERADQAPFVALTLGVRRGEAGRPVLEVWQQRGPRAADAGDVDARGAEGRLSVVG
jgi:hypothetical protein